MKFLQTKRGRMIAGSTAAVVAVLLLVAAAISGTRGSADFTSSYTAEPSQTNQTPLVVSPSQIRPEGRPMRALFLGTSITSGMASSTLQYAWPNLVVQALGQGGPVERIAIPKLPEPPGTAATTSSYAPEAIPAGLDLGVVELVTNDKSKTELDAYRENFGRLITTFRQKNPNATLVCPGAWASLESPNAHEETARELCVRAGGYYVPINFLFEDPQNRGPASNVAEPFGADNFHPNNLGEMRIAAEVLGALRGFYPGVPTS
ncbi:SGNH/GDSL hydrolase family protein [Rhodococcus sp. JVH1]|uniref:SGNH/GDSL hydrolase family protein n=1 Tax=Rhodococcus sp. JVH1 TaxID=745408 RepID=UPI000271E0EC|nr:SGNH/GDSL hydrolase family protein [Rhodococcus sp. JVH1]EJI95518.1 hypothetical protein JVH1_7039 [Rhodococcus sp. JVH1]